MRLNLSILIFLSLSLKIYSQYTPLINSNRPGKSESPYAVGTKILQIESGLDLGQLNNHKTNYYQSSYNLNTAVRYGFFSEKLEFKAYAQYAKEQVNNFQTAFSYGGGIKYLIYMPKMEDHKNDVFSWKERHKFEWKRLIPSIGFSANYHRNWMGLNEDAVSTNILLQNQLSNTWTFVTNLNVDGIMTDFLTFENILTSTFNINSYWSVYLENQNRINKHFKKSDFSLGLVYLKTKDLQFDISTKAVFLDESISYFLLSGMSWRLDKHKDKFKDKDEELRKRLMGIEKPKNLIQRTFGKVGSLFGKIFKKKNNDSIDGDLQTEDIDTENPNNTIEAPEKPKKKGLFKKLFSKKKKENDEGEETIENEEASKNEEQAE